MRRQSSGLGGHHARWAVQLRKGILEFVILLSLSRREQYGFELVTGMTEHAAIDVPEGTIYPLLLRLAKDGLVQSELRDGDGGARRKYYTLTHKGSALLAAMIPSWQKLAASVDGLLGGHHN